MDNSIGYLRIPAIHPKDKQKKAKKVRKALMHLSNQNVENWIIDLRYNTEGQYIKKLILLILSTGIFTGRNDNIYAKNIPVDTPNDFDPFLNIDQDPAILEAIRWCICP